MNTKCKICNIELTKENKCNAHIIPKFLHNSSYVHKTLGGKTKPTYYVSRPEDYQLGKSQGKHIMPDKFISSDKVWCKKCD